MHALQFATDFERHERLLGGAQTPTKEGVGPEWYVCVCVCAALMAIEKKSGTCATSAPSKEIKILYLILDILRNFHVVKRAK